MASRVEKLSLLSEMIAFAKVDDTLKTIEYNFLIGIARQLDITQDDFDYLLNHPVNYAYLKTHSETNCSVPPFSFINEFERRN